MKYFVNDYEQNALYAYYIDSDRWISDNGMTLYSQYLEKPLKEYFLKRLFFNNNEPAFVVLHHRYAFNDFYFHLCAKLILPVLFHKLSDS